MRWPFKWNRATVGFAIAVIGFFVVGAISTFEVWQAITDESIVVRGGRIPRTTEPLSFWLHAVVSGTLAAVFWSVLIFAAGLLVARMWLSRHRGPNQ